MYAYIIGNIIEKNDNNIIIENNDIGYQIFMPYSNIVDLEIGKKSKIYTYYNVSEDNISLFGFSNTQDKKMFEKLISVSKIGAKTAIGILSNTTAQELATAVVTEDVKELSKLPGIGKKTAQRIILEIKDKIDTKEIISLENTGIQVKTNMEEKLKINDVTEALLVLGYTNYDISKIVEELDTSKSTEELIKDALKIIN